MKYYLIAFTIPLFICLFWFFELFFSSGENKSAKKHLAIFMLFGSFVFLGELLFHNQYFRVYSSIYNLIVFATIAQIPAFYLYLISLTEKRINLKRYIKHFSFPFLISVILFYFHFILLSREDSIALFANFYSPELLGQHLKTTYIVELVARNSFLLLAIFYLITIRLKVKRHFKEVMNYCSDSDSKNLKWISLSTLFFIIILLISATVCNPITKEVIYYYEYSIVIPFLLYGVVFWFIGFLGNRQELAILPYEPNTNSASIPDSLKSNIIEQLILTMEKDKLYLLPNLTLPELAQKTGTNRYYLSKLINDEYEMNFNQFINKYRIGYAIDLMINEDNENNEVKLYEIASKSGFNSYISFIRGFKRITKKTPEEFYNSLKK